MVAATSKGTRYSKLACRQQKPGDTAAASARSVEASTQEPGPCQGRANHRTAQYAAAQLIRRGSEMQNRYARAQHKL